VTTETATQILWRSGHAHRDAELLADRTNSRLHLSAERRPPRPPRPPFRGASHAHAELWGGMGVCVHFLVNLVLNLSIDAIGAPRGASSSEQRVDRSRERERSRSRERERERERERRSLGLGALGPGPLPGRPRPRLEVQVRMMTRRFIQAEGASLRRLLKVQRRVCK